MKNHQRAEIIKNVIINDEIIEMEIIKTVKAHGNTSYVTLPKDLEGKRVIIYYKKEEKNNGKNKK